MTEVLLELALLFALCVAVAVAFHRFRLPPLVGFLVTGAIVGPYSVGLVQHEDVVRELAEVGVVVLLFTVGMEVPFGQLRQLRRLILVGGGLQLGLTIGLSMLVGLVSGMHWNVALLLGFLLSLSSTAAVSKVLVDHGEFSSPHGRLGIGICVAQDLAVVPMILLLPLLFGGGEDGETIGKTLRNLGLLVGVVALAKVLVPRILDMVARTRSRELFVLTLATVCLSMAAVTAFLGMSLALGAFLAGILLADTDHHAHAAAEVEPFRDALASLFFVSIGMLFDWRTIVAAPWLVLLALSAVLAGKTAIVMLASRALGLPGWVQFRAGLLLAQVGEFSFVLVTQVSGALPKQAERIFLVVAVLSIALTPVLFAMGKAVVTRARRRDGEGAPRGPQRSGLVDHAIVIGYGPTGRTLVAALRSIGLPVVAAEMNAATVKAEKAKGVPIVLADATRIPVLKALGIERARILVLAVNDGGATTRITQVVRQVAPHVHILARAAYIAEVERLHQLGAHEVVPQELEASVEILVRVLRRYLVPDDEVGRQVAIVRAAANGLAKAAGIAGAELARLAELVPGLGFAVFQVADDAEAQGRSIGEIGVRKRTGCSVVVVRRGNVNLSAITPELQFEGGDVVVVVGPEARLADAGALFHTRGERRATMTAGDEVS